MMIPGGSARTELVVKRSKFISLATPFSESDSVKDFVAQTRDEFSGCNHVVYAFSVGPDGDRFGYSDDREPKGSAGRPVFEVLKGRSVTNVLVRVVRFFGGVKLGIGGLVHAYSESAKNVLDELPTIELVKKIAFEFGLEYRYFETVRKLIREMSGSMSEPRFAEIVEVSGTLPVDLCDDFADRIRDLTNGRVADVFVRGSNRA